MDEWEIGKSYYLEGDKPGWYVYKGGDPSKDASWARGTNSGTTSQHSAASDFARMALQSASFGWADEIAGALGGDAEASRARVAQIQQDRPRVALAGQLAGMLPMAVAPVGAAAGGIARGAGLLGTMVRGAGVGAVEGGLLGAGESDNGNRLVGAGVGAAGGAATGGVMGGIGGIVASLGRRAAGRGARIADALQEGVGVRGSPREARTVTQTAVRSAREQGYQPLEQAHTAINDANLLGLLRSEPYIAHTRVISREVADGKRAPSYTEVQRIVQHVEAALGKKASREEVGAINRALENAAPGHAAADAAYREAQALNVAYRNGGRLWNAHSEEVEMALEGLSPEARAQFRRGQLARIVRSLELRNEGNVSGGVLRRFLDAGPETERALRTMFDDPAKYDEFRRLLQREHSAERVLAALRRLAPPAAVGIGLGAGSGAVSAMAQ